MLSWFGEIFGSGEWEQGRQLVLEVHVMRGGAGGGEGDKGKVGMHIKNALKDFLFSNIRKIEDSPYNF